MQDVDIKLGGQKVGEVERIWEKLGEGKYNQTI